MKHKRILFLLFIFLALGFWFFKADFAQGASGVCHCLITNPDDIAAPPLQKDFPVDEADCPPKADSVTGLAQTCTWKVLSGKCTCDIVNTDTGEIEEGEEVADKSEEQCGELEETDVEGGGKHYKNCFWDITGLPSGWASEGTAEAVVKIPSVAGLNTLQSTDVKVIFGKAIYVATGLLGSIALALFAYAGVLWMLSGGNAEKATKARNILIWATMGLFVILSSYTLVKFIFSAVE